MRKEEWFAATLLGLFRSVSETRQNNVGKTSLPSHDKEEEKEGLWVSENKQMQTTAEFEIQIRNK